MTFEINDLLNNALLFKDVKHDLDIALKYAYMAAVLSYSPRADVCCTIGEIYLEKKNYEWARFWYEKALNNMNMSVDEEMVDADYYTVIPLLKLGFITHKMGDDDASEECFRAVLKVRPDDEVAKNNIAILEKTKKEQQEISETTENDTEKNTDEVVELA